MKLDWRFPAAEPHSGIPLGNGTFGALIWGEGRDVRITINRADYWDHRGGLAPDPEASYTNLRRWLAEGNETRLREVFEGRKAGSERPERPTRLPMGRVDLELPPNLALQAGTLDMERGVALIDLDVGAQQAAPAPASHHAPASLRAVMRRDAPVLVVTVQGASAADLRVVSRPPDALEVVERFRRTGMPPAIFFGDDTLGGWVQECPGEPVMAAAWRKDASPSSGAAAEMVTISITSVFGATPAEAEAAARRTLDDAVAAGAPERHEERVADWWRDYWARSASVHLPDATLELLYHLGMYKLAGLTVPGSPAATLQGPWVEEYRLPPWSSDYHFNINVQECHWPAYGGNQLGALDPLFAMVRSWEPRLRENARIFAGIDDGLLLPHAVDDRCTGMGGFWTGAVDHGSTAWTAQLMWLYYRYTMDERFLRDTAYPFLRGALRVYETMLEEVGYGATGGEVVRWRGGDGDDREGPVPPPHHPTSPLALPVSVSPEFGGAGAHAWGANASFQLAIIHFLCRTVAEASQLLGVDAEHRARWQEIDRRLPLGSIQGEGGREQLLLWDGQPLSESHRHHSHLAGIFPFDIFDIDGADRALVRNSMRTLTRMGMGQWTGWCVPWASILHARLGNGEAAALLLEIFRRTFMGPGHASTHDAGFPGLTIRDGRPDIMQIEAAMGAAAAVLEMLLHTRNAVLRLFPAVPAHWPEASFERIRAEGAFLVSATWRNGQTQEVRIHSEAGASLRLANPWGDAPVSVERDGAAAGQVSGTVLELPTRAGERLVLSRT